MSIALFLMVFFLPSSFTASNWIKYSKWMCVKAWFCDEKIMLYKYVFNKVKAIRVCDDLIHTVTPSADSLLRNVRILHPVTTHPFPLKLRKCGIWSKYESLINPLFDPWSISIPGAFIPGPIRRRTNLLLLQLSVPSCHGVPMRIWMYNSVYFKKIIVIIFCVCMLLLLFILFARIYMNVT